MSRSDRISNAAGRYVENNKFSGIEWYVEHRGEVLAEGSTGYAHAATRTPIPQAAIYRIYSMTKPVVAVMAMILMEQGKLRLYDVLPGFNAAFANMRVLLPNGSLVAAERAITVDDLFTHRAGFTYEFIAGCHVAPYYRDNAICGDGTCSLDGMMDRLAVLPLAFQPGSQFRYSVSTDVLAHVIERAAGQPIDELLAEHIFAPLGMTDTAYHVPAAKADRLMSMYGSGDIVQAPPLRLLPHELTEMDVEEMYPMDRPHTFRRGGHGLFSTLSDYTKFARFLLDGRGADGKPIISRKMVDLMRANRIPPEQLPIRIGMNEMSGYGWGLGVRVMMDLGRAKALTGMGELGWAGAASTYFWVDPAERMLGVIMTQYLGSMLPLSDDLRVAAYQMLD